MLLQNTRCKIKQARQQGTLHKARQQGTVHTVAHKCTQEDSPLLPPSHTMLRRGCGSCRASPSQRRHRQYWCVLAPFCQRHCRRVGDCDWPESIIIDYFNYEVSGEEKTLNKNLKVSKVATSKFGLPEIEGTREAFYYCSMAGFRS